MNRQTAAGRFASIVIWDFDGTIADTFPAIRAATGIALAACGQPSPNPGLLRSTIGLSLPLVFARLAPTLSAEQIDEVVAEYRRAFTAAGPAHSVLYSGIHQILEWLELNDVPSGIATSKGRTGVELMLRHLRVHHFFDAVVSDEDVEQGKPHPDMVLSVCERLGLSPEGAVVVGDTAFDIEMGRRAGSTTIAVTWGNHRSADLASAFPTRIASSADELRQHLGDLLGL